MKSKYAFVTKINGIDETGICDLTIQKVICICDKEQSEIILKAFQDQKNYNAFLENKSVYRMKLHESILVKEIGQGWITDWKISRVPGGWFYQDTNPRIEIGINFFVPYNDDCMDINTGA